MVIQGWAVPVYSAVEDHVDCGGMVTPYYNAPLSVTAQKNDCALGVGSIVRYAFPGGMYRSLTSQSDADTQALTYANTQKQAYANTNGHCNV